MSRVSGVFGTTVAAPPSSQSTSKSSDSGADGSSFGDALDRAQANKTDEKKASVSNAAAKIPAPKTGKAAGGRQLVVKKAIDQENTDQAKVQKKAESQSSGNSDSPLGDENAGADAEQSADDSGKGQRKSSTAAIAAAPQETPSAIVQLQGAIPAQDVQTTAGGSPKEGASSKKLATTAAVTTTKTGQSGARKPLETDARASDENASASESSDGASAQADSSNAPAEPARSRLAIQPRSAAGSAGNASQDPPVVAAQQAALASTTGDVAAAAQAAAVGPAVPSAKADRKNAGDLLLQALPSQTAANAPADTSATDDTSDVDNSQASSGSQFADANHPKIISSITGRLLPNGGSMQIRLDPPELGAMQIRVEMHNGTMTASFETSNDQATRLLSHSLGDLRSALAAQGINVEKLQVSQSPKQQQSSSGDSQQDNSQNPQDTASQQEQQRKEMVRRMWQKLMGGSDPVDLVA